MVVLFQLSCNDEVFLPTFMEAREVSGMPFSYFPVMIPHASGDHVIAPTPVAMEANRRIFSEKKCERMCENSAKKVRMFERIKKR